MRPFVIFVMLLAPAQATAGLVTNGSFESVTPALKTNEICTTNQAVYPSLDPGYYPACAAAGWTGNYQIGNGKTIGYSGVSFGIPQPDPDGTNALILQTEHNLAPTANQSILIPADGLYTLSFYVANRSSPSGDTGPQTLYVLLDNSAIEGGTYTNLPAKWTLETLTFTATSGSHLLTFQGLSTSSTATSARVAAFVDSVSLVPAFAPTISLGGVAPIDSPSNTIQPGEWISIYGTNLASESATWNGDFPQSLGGTSVTIDGKPAYLWFVSPGQINLQAPDDAATGVVNVVVTTASGIAGSTVTLAQFAPAFNLLDSEHVVGIILRFDGSGAYGGGTYDILGPTGTSLGYPTVAAKAGDSVVLFGVGFGPTNPAVPAGQIFSGAAPATNPVTLLIDNMPVTPSFAGLSEAGLFQINLTLPAGLGSGDVPLLAKVGGAQTQSTVVMSVQ